MQHISDQKFVDRCLHPFVLNTPIYEQSIGSWMKTPSTKNAHLHSNMWVYVCICVLTPCLELVLNYHLDIIILQLLGSARFFRATLKSIQYNADRCRIPVIHYLMKIFRKFSFPFQSVNMTVPLSPPTFLLFKVGI